MNNAQRLRLASTLLLSLYDEEETTDAERDAIECAMEFLDEAAETWGQGGDEPPDPAFDEYGQPVGGAA